MSTNVKNVVLKKKIEGVIYDLMIKTNADLVFTSEGKTVSAVLTELVATIATKATTEDIDSRINEIVNGAPETYDTLKEIAEYISTHEDVVTALNSAIGNKVDKVEGKSLSTNDFTDELKTKLESLSDFSGSADDIEETSSRKFVTAEEKTKIESSARVIVSATEPEDLTNNDLWCEDITEE